jgi:hypothetical protein
MGSAWGGLRAGPQLSCQTNLVFLLVCVPVCWMQVLGAVGEVEGSVEAWVILPMEEAEDIESDLGEQVRCNPNLRPISVRVTCLMPA